MIKFPNHSKKHAPPPPGRLSSLRNWIFSAKQGRHTVIRIPCHFRRTSSRSDIFRRLVLPMRCCKHDLKLRAFFALNINFYPSVEASKFNRRIHRVAIHSRVQRRLAWFRCLVGNTKDVSINRRLPNFAPCRKTCQNAWRL